MLESLQAAWRARRVLLTGEADGVLPVMDSLLGELGARPRRIPADADNETIARALTHGRVACMIVMTAQAQQLDTFLHEAREAGVPLVILLEEMAGSAAHTPSCKDVSILRILYTPQMQIPEICAYALSLGARFLLGHTELVGIFTLDSSARPLAQQ